MADPVYVEPAKGFRQHKVEQRGKRSAVYAPDEEEEEEEETEEEVAAAASELLHVEVVDAAFAAAFDWATAVDEDEGVQELVGVSQVEVDDAAGTS